jgi:hypothetical protein
MSAPAYVPALVLAMSIGMLCLSLVGLRLALVWAAWPQSAQVWTMRAAAVLLVGWFAVALALALVEAAAGAHSWPAASQHGALAPTVVAAPPIRRSEPAGRIIDALPQRA